MITGTSLLMPPALLAPNQPANHSFLSRGLFVRRIAATTDADNFVEKIVHVESRSKNACMYGIILTD